MKLTTKKNNLKSGKSKPGIKGKIKKKKGLKPFNRKSKQLGINNVNNEGSMEEEEEMNESDEMDNGDVDDLNDELNESEGLDHKKALEKLKKTDPEFYKFLEENDKSLLEFDDGVGSSDDDDDGDEDEKIHKPPKPGELEVNSDEDDFDDEKVVSKRSDNYVTLKMVKTWQDELQNDKSVGTISTVIKAFHGALLSITGVNEGDEDQSAEYKVEGSAVFNAVVQLCVLELQPALIRFLRLPTENNALASQLSKLKKWSKVKSILKLYFTDLLKLLSGVTSDHILCVMLKHIHQMSAFVCYFHRIVKLLLRRLVYLWSGASEETVRVLAFLCILRITTSNQRNWLEPALKMMYTSYIRNSKFVSPSTLPGINFMRRSLTEILAIDSNISYHHAFLYIRQLAIHLRNGIVLHKKESIQSVYNWQYVSSLHLWTDLLSVTYDKPQMQMLIFPLVQVIIGCIKLIPTALYLPLRFHCCKMLIDLSNETGTYIPVLPFILEGLTLVNFDKGHKKLSMKPMDMTCILRLSKSLLQENAFKDAVIEKVYKLLLDCLCTESHRLSFPDLTLLPLIQLKKFCKDCKTNKYQQKIRGAINKIEENSKFIENERKRVTFSLSDKKAVEVWERSVLAKGTPLSTFCNQLKKIYDQQEAKRITENDKLGEFKLPVLKKGEKKRNREEPLLKLPSSEDDSDDEESLFKLAGENEVDKEAKKEIKKIKKLNEGMKQKKPKESKKRNASEVGGDKSTIESDDDRDDKEDDVIDFKFSDSE